MSSPPPASVKVKLTMPGALRFLNRGCSLGLRGDLDGIHPACESMLRLYPFVFFWGAQSVFHGFSHLALQAPPDGMQDIIWAFSRTPPESADADADISIHHLYGISALNLARTAADVSEDEPVPSPVPSSEAGEDEVDVDVGETTGPPRRSGRIAGFVHATFYIVVIPSGALVVRYAKATGSPAAFNLHRYLQLASVSGRIFRISGLNRYSIGLRKNDDTLSNCTWVTQCSAAYVAMGELVPSPFSSMWSSDWSKMLMQACATIVCAGSRSI